MERWLQRTRGTVGTDDLWNSGYRGPVEQWAQRNRGTLGAKDQRNKGHREQEEQWAQKTREQWNIGLRGAEEQENRGTVGTEEQKNSGPEEQWAQRTCGTVGTIKPIKRFAKRIYG